MSLVFLKVESICEKNAYTYPTLKYINGKQGDLKLAWMKVFPKGLG